MLHISEIVVVEGKYDVIRLSSFLDAKIFATNGFGIFKDKKRLELLRQMAEKNGIVILTDSDGAGLVIRRYLSGSMPGIQIKQAYIPSIQGKEKRKKQVSKEGFLGVEGMNEEVLMKALKNAGISFSQENTQKDWITKARLFDDELTGHSNSAEYRRMFLQLFDLPMNLTTNRLLDWMNVALTEEEYLEALERIKCNQ